MDVDLRDALRDLFRARKYLTEAVRDLPKSVGDRGDPGRRPSCIGPAMTIERCDTDR